MRKVYQAMKAQERVITCYIISLCTVYALFLEEWKFVGFSVKTLLLLLLSLIAMYRYTACLKQMRITRRKKNWFDNMLYLSLALSILHLIISLFITQKQVNTDMLVISMISMYFVISYATKFYLFYFDFLLGASALLYAFLLYHFFIDSSFSFGIQMLIRTKQELAGFLVLTTTISALRYIICKKIWKTRIYLFHFGIGSLLLFINQDMISILITGILFLVIAVHFPPTVELMKKNMMAGFVYFFLLSNMSLLTTYQNIVKNGIVYQLNSSIYIDTGLCIIGLLCAYYLEKLPEHYDERTTLMTEFQRVCRLLAGALGIIIVAVLPHIESLTEQMSGIAAEPCKILINAVKAGMMENQGSYHMIMQQYGMLGIILVTALLLWSIKRIGVFETENTVGEAIFQTIAIIAILQLLLMSPAQSWIAFYVMFIIFAVYSKQGKRNVNEEATENEAV